MIVKTVVEYSEVDIERVVIADAAKYIPGDWPKRLGVKWSIACTDDGGSQNCLVATCECEMSLEA